ncbi:MAG: hypothetical protein M5R40_16435 [Anaerolineae bacterium]|nr:hypothetical protein [Anaerolineae bacterium]
MPTPEEICRILGIEPDRSDPLPQEAFTSNRAYRAHVHRAFVRANPGEHPLRDLAVRVGVDRRTIINYEKHVVTDVYRKPRCKRRPLRRVADLPDLFVRKGKKCGKPQARGYWLEAGGKRYAPTRGNAAMLLGEGFAVDLCRQTASFRYVDASASRTSKAVTPAEQGARAMSRAQQFLLPTMKANDPPAEPEAPADAESVPLSSLDPKTPHLREAQEPLPMSREGVTIARNERYYLHGY